MGTPHTNTVIDINGQRYDARTGQHLGAGNKTAVTRASSRGKRIDGFQRASRSAASPLHPIQPVAPAALRTPSTITAKPRPAHQPAVAAKAHKQQPAKTLMRSAVKKPVIVSPAVIKAQTRTDILAKVPAQLVQPKLSHTKVDHKRMRRAERIIQSPSVSRYSTPERLMPPVRMTPQVKVAAPALTTQAAQFAPVTTAAAPSMDGPVRSSLRTSGTRPVSHRPARPASAARPLPQPAHAEMFEQALRDATSHEQTYHHKKSRGRFGMAASVAVIMLLLVGFLGYQNKPYISMRVAASKSGVEAKLPSYSPAGFSFGDLDYTAGNVVLKYHDKANQTKSFAISQQASDWNSQGLLDNFVSDASKSYQTIERAGRTIYLYGNNTATWVDNGIWYTIDGREALSSTQILDVAMSI